MNGVTNGVMNEVYLVVPTGIDDVTAPSGGNVYDRSIRDGLPAAGWSVQVCAVAGAWPRPDVAARASLGRGLAALPDGSVVVLDGLVACGVPEVVTSHAGRLCLVVLVHLPLGDEAGLAPRDAARLDALERQTLRAASAVVVTSSWAGRRLVGQHGLDPRKVHLATPGADPAPLAHGTDGASRLLCVGSVTPTKGQDLLVEALVALPEQAWTCELVGPLGRDPAHVAGVRSTVERHGLDMRLRLAGPLFGERLAAAYAAADLLVLPSRAESYGMVLTEALARGIPVLATAVGGVPETLGRDPDGRVPGILLPAGDDATVVSGLSMALSRWFAEPSLRAELRGSAAARRATLHGWEVTARCLAAILERVPGTVS